MCAGGSPSYNRPIEQYGDAELMSLSPGPAPTRPSDLISYEGTFDDGSTNTVYYTQDPNTGELTRFDEQSFNEQYDQWSQMNAAYGPAQAELKRREDIKRQLENQNQERETAFKTQQAELDRLKKAQEDAQATQQKTIADLAAQRDAEMSRIAATRAEQEAAVARQRQQQEAALAGQRAAQEAAIAQEQLGTQAVSQSMRVLAMQNAQGSAPTAQQTRGRAPAKARANAASNDLRIGSSGRSSGVGVNIGG
jgi:hypothetical protein